MRKLLSCIIMLMLVITTGCSSKEESLSEYDQHAIECVGNLKRILIDPVSLEVRGDPVVIVNGNETYCFFDAGYKTKGGYKESNTFLCYNGEVICTLQESLDGSSEITSDFQIINYMGLTYANWLDGKFKDNEHKSSGEKVAKELDITYVKL